MATTKRGAKKAPAKKTKAKAKPKKPEFTQAQIERKLDPIAKEVNVRLEKADKNDALADDHRLAAAIRLDDAKAACKEMGVTFKKWAEDNIAWSYDTVRKLARIGGADDPAAAIADMRASRAMQERERRERKSIEHKAAKKAASGKIAGEPEEVARTALAVMPKKQVEQVIREAAGQHKIDVGGADGDPLAAAKNLFDDMPTVDKLRLAEYIGAKLGAEITLYGAEISAAVKKAEGDAPAKRRRRSK